MSDAMASSTARHDRRCLVVRSAGALDPSAHIGEARAMVGRLDQLVHRAMEMVTPRLIFALVVATVFVGLVATPATAAQVNLSSCPATVPAGGQFVGEILIDVGATPLGAYSVTLTYD